MLNAKNMLTAAQTRITEEYAKDNNPNKDYIKDNWDSIKKDIIQVADDAPYMCIVGVGKYDSYKKNPKSAKYDPHKAYTVYFVVYWQNEEDDPIFFNGSEWMMDYPWQKTGDDSYTVNGELIDMKFYFVTEPQVKGKNSWNVLKNRIRAGSHYINPANQ